MRTFLHALAAIALCLHLAGFPLSAGERASKCLPVKSLKESEVVFRGGESLTFAVHYRWGMINADIAKAVVRIDTSRLNGREVFAVCLDPEDI